MAYVPSFEHDLFISYAHADNAGTGRVTAFHKDLVARIQSRLGNRAFHKPKEWVFFDQISLQRGDEFHPKLERAARRSAVMISLVSESYTQAKYCVKETEWFLDSQRLARDQIERRLIPLVLVHTREEELRRHPQLATELLRGSLCNERKGFEPGSDEWNEVLEGLASDIASHLREARQQHGAIFVGQVYGAGESFREKLVGELRGFRCIPEGVVTHEDSLKQALAEAKLAVHFLGDSNEEVSNSLDILAWSLEHCPGKTVGLVPSGRQLAGAEIEALEQIRSHSTWSAKWTQPQGTVVELAGMIAAELEAFRLPDAATPIGLACDLADLEIVRGIAREIHEKEKDAFRVETPDFLANPKALAASEWKKFRTKRQGVVVYWANGQKQRLDQSVGGPLAAALERAWYVSLVGPDAEEKQRWQPLDRETEKIVDPEKHFDHAKLQAFLQRVKEKAGK